jgi:MYXO-CTERM domain-containing protein
MLVRRSIHLLTATLFLAAVLPATAGAVGIAGAFVEGPWDGWVISITLTDDVLSSEDLVSAAIDGSTATGFPILWDSAGRRSDPDGATSSIAGENTQLLEISFSDSPDGFNPGESFSLSSMDPDGDPGPSGVQVGDLAGVEIRFRFRDGSTLVGELVPDLDAGEGMVFQVIPEPQGAALVALGLAALALRRYRRP